MNWVWIFFIMFLLFGGIVGIDEERVLLASEIESERLVLNEVADDYIRKADQLLAEIPEDRKRYNRMLKHHMFQAFVAKIFLERARLEMEMNRK